MKLIHGINGKKVRGRSPNETYSISYTLVPYTTGSLSSPTNTTVKDMAVVSVTGATYNIIDASIQILAPTTYNTPYTITNLTPSIATLNGYTLNALATGNASIIVNDGYTKKQIDNIPVSKTATSGGYTNITGYSVGTLATALTTSINNLIASVTPSTTTMNITATNDWSTVMTRNINLWAGSIDMTAFMISSGTYAQVFSEGGQKSATVISPNHVVSANHHRPARGYWIANDGSIVYRDISSWVQIGTGDIAIGYVATAFPSTIKKISILPSNWKSYLPSVQNVGSVYGIPVAYADSGNQSGDPATDYTRRLAIGSWYGTGQLAYGSLDEFQLQAPTNAKQLSFYSNQVAPYVLFRSGSPVFAVLGTEPILLGCWHAASGQSYAIAPMLSDFITDINAAMLTLSTAGGTSTYTINTISLSGYPIY